MAANPTMTYSFTNGTTAAANEVNANFTTLVNWITNNAMQLDGSVAFTSIPSGPASDPTTDNQLTRKAYVDATASSVGDIKMGGWAAAPSGWLLCQGQLVSRATYSALFAVVGTTFGAGDGSTTFGLPDLRGRSPMGSGTGTGLTARTLGANVGTETHTLTGAQSGTSVHNHTQNSHNHTQDSHNHTQDGHNHTQDAHNHTQDPHFHTLQGLQPAGLIAGTGTTRYGLNNVQYYSDNGLATNQPSTATNQAATATNQAQTATNQAQTATNIATSAANAAEAHTIVQPVQVVNFAIKY